MIPLKDDIPTRTFPFITILLIFTNAILFFYQRSLDVTSLRQLIYRFGCIPYEITHGADVVDVYVNGSVLSPVISQGSGFPVHITLVSSVFLHGSWLHMIGNMLFLYIFGDNVEDWLGHGLFLLFYLGCGIAANVAHSLISFNSTVPAIGASGAVAGIMGAYLILYPRARVLTLVILLFFIRFVMLPAYIFLGFWIFIQILSSFLGLAASTNIAFFAHIGGFFVGLLIIRKLKMRRTLGWRT